MDVVVQEDGIMESAGKKERRLSSDDDVMKM